MTTFTIKNEADMIALVPVLFGFEPEKSLVMLTFDSFHARVDLPDESNVSECIDLLLEPAEKHSVQRVAFLIYDDGNHPSLEALLTLRFINAGIQPLIGLQVRGGAFRRFDTTNWQPLDIQTHPMVMDAHYEGLASPYRTRADMEAYVRPCGAGASNRAQEAIDFLALAGVDDVVSSLTRETAGEALKTWTEALRSCQPGSAQASSVAVVVGFASWLSGNGALAWVAVDQAGDYPLAVLLRVALEKAVSPSTWSSLRA